MIFVPQTNQQWLITSILKPWLAGSLTFGLSDPNRKRDGGSCPDPRVIAGRAGRARRARGRGIQGFKKQSPRRTTSWPIGTAKLASQTRPWIFRPTARLVFVFALFGRQNNQRSRRLFSARESRSILAPRQARLATAQVHVYAMFIPAASSPVRHGASVNCPLRGESAPTPRTRRPQRQEDGNAVRTGNTAPTAMEAMEATEGEVHFYNAECTRVAVHPALHAIQCRTGPQLE